MAESVIKSMRAPFLELGPNPTSAILLFEIKFKTFMKITFMDDTETKQAKKTEFMKDIFITQISDEALSIIQKSKDLDSFQNYEEMLNVLKTKYEKAKLPSIERQKFYELHHNPNDSVCEYIDKLKEQSKSCEFGAICESLIIDKLKNEVKNQQIVEMLIKDECNDQQKPLDDLIKQIKHIENYQERLKNVEECLVIKSDSSKTDKNSKQCERCGRYHKLDKKYCKAYGETCNKCNKKNHFAKFCKTKPNDYSKHKSEYQTFKNKNKTMKSVKTISDENAAKNNDSYNDDSEDSIGYIGEIDARGCVDDFYIKIQFKNVRDQFKYYRCLMDTGSKRNVIGLANLQSVLKDENVVLDPNKRLLKAFDGTIVRTLGAKVLSCRCGNNNFNLKFDVVDFEHQPILSGSTCIRHNLIQINVKNEMYVEGNVNIVSSLDSPQQILHQFSDLFDGMGCIDTAPVKFDVNEQIVPVQEKPRRIPIAMRESLKLELERLKKLNIIEKIPTVEEILPELSNARVFTLLDLKSGFWQLKLEEESQNRTCFWTPFGRYKWLRLPFGINAAPEIFQLKQMELLSGLKNVEVIADDILVFGKGDTHSEALRDHNDKLVKLLTRLQEKGVKLNQEKVRLAQTELTFFGHVISKDGLKPDQSKISAITNLKRPVDKAEVQRILGVATYLSKFIPNLSKLVWPLRDLTRTDSIFNWQDSHQFAFDELKKYMCQMPILKYFDPGEKTTIQCDASSKGLGACLLQLDRPVVYISRALNKTEQQYAQIEKECLAIVFACRRLDQYITGKRNIIVESDHKPLQTIFKKPINTAPKRLQRMLLALQKYDILVTYKPGSQMFIADTLSRNFEQNNKSELKQNEVYEISQIESLLSSIAKVDSCNDLENDSRIEEIKKVTRQDETMQQLMDFIVNGWMAKRNDSNEINSFKPYFHELSIQNGLITKGDRIIIPRELRSRYLKILHKSHQGMESCIKRARSVIFWPKINEEIRALIKSCVVCQKFQDHQQKEPMETHDIPTFPFERISMDFAQVEYLKTKRDMLILVDHYSDWIEFEILKATNTKSIIQFCKKIFSRYGIPNVVVTDGAPNFTSSEFQEFAKDWSFIHVTSSPYHPKGNGKAESSVKIMKRIIRKCEDDNSCIFKAILDYRCTPNNSGFSPTERLMARTLRGNLPVLDKNLIHKVPQGVREKIAFQRKKAKFYYDRGAKEMKKLITGQGVLVRVKPDDKILQPGTITEKLNNRDYEVSVNNATYIRNREFIYPKSTGDNQTCDASALNPNMETDTTANQMSVFTDGATSTQPCEQQNNQTNLRRSARSNKGKTPAHLLKDFNVK